MSAPIACVEIHHLGDTWCVFVTRLVDGAPQCTKIGAYQTLWEAASVTSTLAPDEPGFAAWAAATEPNETDR